MHIPLPSVIALARHELVGEHLSHAKKVLSQESDWQEWINQIELHGLSGFANKHLAEHGLPIPSQVSLPLKALKARHTAAANARYQVLCEIDSVFKQNSIPYVALKGAALMPYLFKEGYLRPMRDMDLLLPQEYLLKAAECMRSIGFDLPETQPSKFMRDTHQLPNASKTVNGMLCSVEIHHNGVSRDTSGNLFYPKSADSFNVISWGELKFQSLEDVQMLHQVTKHLQGVHPGGFLKLINVMDVVGLAEHILASGQWQNLERRYPHVINALRCIHLLTPLPDSLQRQIGEINRRPEGVGQIMASLTTILLQKRHFLKTFKLLFLPSDWWLHLYYNVDPNASLLWVKLVRHPLRISNWLLRRAYSSLRGG